MPRAEIEVDVEAAGARAGQAVVGIGEEGRAVELVGARAQHDVDRAALEIAFGHVERRHPDRELLDRVIGHGAARGRQAAIVQAEIVRELDAVDREAVEAAVLAGDLDRAAVGEIDRREGIAPGEVANVAVDRGDAGDVVAVEAGDRAVRGLARAAHAGDHDHVLLTAELDGNAERLAGLEVDVGDSRGSMPGAVTRTVNGPPTRRPERPKVPLASVVVVAGCPRDVGDHDLGIGDRRAARRDVAADARCGFLSECSCRRHNGRGRAKQCDLLHDADSPEADVPLWTTIRL